MSLGSIPWRGPRPLRFHSQAPGDVAQIRSLLVGREVELEELFEIVQSYSVVQITAASGVGKTSFVNGAAPLLAADGCRILGRRPWQDVLPEYDRLAQSAADRDQVAALYCLALGVDPISTPDLPTLLAKLGEDAAPICVFDQMEELLRWRKPLARALLTLIGRVAQVAGVTHVVIARSEFRNELRATENRGRASWHMELEEIRDPKTIRQIIAVPAEGHAEISPDVLDKLVTWWVEARSSVASLAEIDGVRQELGGEYGLLHLQALLWSIQQSLPGVHTLDRDALRTFLEGRDLDWEATGPMVMDDAMFRYVEETIEQCDYPRWPNGPRLMTARIAGYLSSAGYKVPQAASTLVPLSLAEELASPNDARELAAKLRSVGPEARKEEIYANKELLLEPAGLAAQWPADEVDAGAVMEAMVTSLFLALDRLSDDEEANVLRKFLHGHDAVYELVHDGVGTVIRRWAESLLDHPVATIGRISVQSGQPMRHDLSCAAIKADQANAKYWGQVAYEQLGDRELAVIGGAKWIGNKVGRGDAPLVGGGDAAGHRLGIDSIMFRDSDFRGTAFIDVDFSDVVFDASVLQGVAMIRCGLDAVRFTGGGPAAFDTLTIVDPRPDASVAFSGLVQTTGLIIFGIDGGSWSFENCRIEHLVLKSESQRPLNVRFLGATAIDHLTLEVSEATTTAEVGADVKITNSAPSVDLSAPRNQGK